MSAGSSVTGSAGEESTMVGVSFSTGCSGGGTVEQSTHSDSEVSFETAIKDS